VVRGKRGVLRERIEEKGYGWGITGIISTYWVKSRGVANGNETERTGGGGQE